MTLQQQWETCLAQACEITKRTKNEYHGIDLLAFQAGTSSQGGSNWGSGLTSGSSSFSRTGAAESQRTYNLPAALSGLLSRSYQGSEVDPTLRALENAFVSLVYGDASGAEGTMPGINVMQQSMDLDPTDFQGSASLTNIINRNPYSTDFKEGMGEEFDSAYDTARARTLSGPANVRGGQARQALELSETNDAMSRGRFGAVQGQQNAEANLVTQAVQIANQLESMRRGQALQAQGQYIGTQQAQRGQAFNASDVLSKRYTGNMANVQLASELLGAPKQVTSENFSGSGFQSSATNYSGGGSQSGNNFSGGCCFIFLECLNGTLPWYVRKGRDDFGTSARRRGYIWMSRWLVPLMQKVPVAKTFVNTVMIQPFLKWGQHLYAGGPRKWSYYKPLCWSWFYLWSLLGSTVRKDNYAGQ